MRRLVILGAGGHGAVVADAAKLMARWESIEFLDENPNADASVLGCPLAGGFERIRHYIDSEADLFVAIGSNYRRRELMLQVAKQGGRLTTVVHPAATVSDSADISYGTLVAAGAVIGPRCRIGAGSIINTTASIDHDCRLGTAVHLSPGALLAGEVVLNNLVWVGIGATINDGLTVGASSVIGASAAVVSDVGENRTMVGIPARDIGSARCNH